MKTDTHPTNYRKVIFQDASADTSFLIGSTIETEDVATWTDGNEYPLYKVEISSASHPFYTGNEKVMDTAGRVDKFKKRMEQAAAKAPKKAAPAPVPEVKEEVAPEAPVEEVADKVND